MWQHVYWWSGGLAFQVYFVFILQEFNTYNYFALQMGSEEVDYYILDTDNDNEQFIVKNYSLHTHRQLNASPSMEDLEIKAGTGCIINSVISNLTKQT